MVNFRIVYLAQFLTDLNNLGLKIYALFKTEKNIKIKQKTFVLMLLNRRYFFGTPGKGSGYYKTIQIFRGQLIRNSPPVHVITSTNNTLASDGIWISNYIYGMIKGRRGLPFLVLYRVSQKRYLT